MNGIIIFSKNANKLPIKNVVAKGLFILFFLFGFNTAFGQTKVTATTAGTTNFTAPTGVTGVTVQLWGAGGAGGGSGFNKKAGSGGGGGAYNFSNTVAVTPGTTYNNSVVVGTGGTGVLSTNGGNGNNSSVSFGSSLSANGGKGGAASAVNTTPIGDGGAVGTFRGGNGGSGVQGVNGPGGGGGSSAGIAANGNNGTGTTAGAAVTGGGAGGAAGTQSVNGSPGSNPGGGGGGGGDTAGSNNTAGGNGGVGQAIISYFLLTGTSNITICNGTAATITVSGTTTNLPVGSYTVVYDLASPNASTNNTATMTVSTAGTATFTTVMLSNAGSTGITITSITATLTGIIYKTSYDATGNANNIATITVSANNTAAVPSTTPTLCINTALTAITHTTTGATGIGTVTGLPAGVTATWASNTITVSGTPTASGTFNYNIPLTGGCGSANATGTITVMPNNTAGTASSTPTLCINTVLADITHATTGATGIGTATGLPAGVTAAWASNTITISGTPTASGTFNYSILLIGGCGSVSASGTITVLINTVTVASSAPTLCINTALTNITHTTTGATGIGIATGLPTGVSATWSSNMITISGTPTASGAFNYSIPLTGGCGNVNATGAITVSANNTAGAASSTPTLCINTSLTNITHSTTGSTGIGTATGLPAGITAAWASNTITIGGTPTASGAFNYSIPLTGGCANVNAVGTITVETSVGGNVSGTTNICSGSTSGLLTLSGHTGSVVRWEYSVSPFSSWTTISNTSTTYTSVSLTQTTYFRAVVQYGSCAEVNSSPAVITINKTTSTDGGATWSNGTPTSSVSAEFDGSSAIISADFSACSLRLKNNAIVTVLSGFDVTLDGTLTVDSGSTFTLNNNSNLIQNTTLANSGNIVVKRNSSALKRLDYTLWSSPVTGQGLYAFSPFTFANRFYVYNTATNLYTNSVGFSISGLNSDGVNGVDNNNVQFASAKSYLIRLPWNHPTAPAIWNGLFTGVPNNGNVTFAMTTGYNAVGNPYPSRINVHNFIDGNTNISGPLYFWRKTNDTNTTSYATLTKIAYVANGAAGGDTGTGYFNTGDETNWVINIGQGFIVNANSSTNLSFTNSMRRSSNSDQFFKSGQPTTASINSGLYWLNLNTDTGIYSQMAVGYSSEGTLSEDRGIDGKNINPEFYLTSLIAADEYSVQGRPDFQPNDIVALSYKVATGGEYAISIDHTAGIFNGGSQSIYLKDNLTTIIHNLNTGAYSFTSTAGTFSNRFEIIYALPLGAVNPIFTANNVVIYNQNSEFVVDTGNITMSSVKVFDIRGRLLQERKDINANHTTIGNGLSNQVLLVQITSEDGITVTRKVIR